jgi:hypothetical protein
MNQLKKCLIFAFFFIVAIAAEGSTRFGLFLFDPIDDKSTYKILNDYLNKVDDKIERGIRYGVDRLVTVHLGYNSLNLESPQCENLDESQYVQIVNKQILVLNSHLKEMILSNNIRQKIGECSHHDLLIKSMERTLLKLKDAYHFDKDFTSEVKNELSLCQNSLLKETKRTFKLGQPMSLKCIELNQIVKKREAYLQYKQQVQSLINLENIEFDISSYSDTTLQKYNICQSDYTPTKTLTNGKNLKMLGMAIVYMAPGYTTSVAGHLAERYIYCLNNELKDIMFEYSQMTKAELGDLSSVYPKESSGVSQDYLKSLVGSIYMKVKHNPANNEGDGYGFNQFHTNRDIVEVWPKFTQEEMFDGLQVSLDEFKKQKEMYKNREIFEKYSLLHNNCTHPVKEKMKSFRMESWKLIRLKGWRLFGFLIF